MYSGLFQKPDGIYLLSHSVGLQPINNKTVVEKLFFDVWAKEPEPWTDWLQGINIFKNNLAGLFNAEASEFCPQANLSSALSKIIGSLPKRKGKKKILLSENDFPSMGFVLAIAKDADYQLQFMPKDIDLTVADNWDKLLTEDLICTLITHVQSNTGIQVPVSEVTKICRMKGIISIVDIAQSCGVLSIDFKKWHADFILGSCVKWLCGGPGAGYLWADHNIVSECKPVDVGWFSHDDPFEFDIKHFKYAQGVNRFWGGTPSILPYINAGNSLEVIRKIGIDTIRQHNVSLSNSLIQNLQDQVLQNSKLEELRGGTLILDFKSQQEAVVNKLQSADVHFDSRSNGLRLSFHIYNSQEDVWALTDILN